jgi:hypothetical protein
MVQLCQIHPQIAVFFANKKQANSQVILASLPVFLTATMCSAAPLESIRQNI